MATGGGDTWAGTTTDHKLNHFIVTCEDSNIVQLCKSISKHAHSEFKDTGLPFIAASSSADSPLSFLAFTSQGADPGGPLALASCAFSTAMHCKTYSTTFASPLNTAPCRMVFLSSVKHTVLIPSYRSQHKDNPVKRCIPDGTKYTLSIITSETHHFQLLQDSQMAMTSSHIYWPCSIFILHK